jgi:hypothetical protein
MALGDRYSTCLSVFVDTNELLVPKLSRVQILVQSKDIQLIKTFAKNYGNSLKSVSLEALAFNAITGIQINVLMKQIVYLKNLKRLELSFDFDQTSNQEFIDNLRAIAIHCYQLKRFELTVFWANPLLDKQIFNCLSFFKNLNYLYLFIGGEESNEISCQSLKELKQLTHLKVESPPMNDIFFEDIDKHLPQLKHLLIYVSNDITDKALNSLSKLQKLQSIEIHCSDDIDKDLPFITDSGLIDVINNCSQMNSIKLNYLYTDITNKTMNALIALALRKPRIQFNHQFQYLEEEDEEEDNFDNEIEFPNNLIIDYYQ